MSKGLLHVIVTCSSPFRRKKKVIATAAAREALHIKAYLDKTRQMAGICEIDYYRIGNPVLFVV